MIPTWERDGIQLFLGDCLEVLPTLAAGSVDAVVTDPPYGVGLVTKRTHYTNKGTLNKPAQYEATPDTPDYIATVVVPAIEQCRTIAKAVALTPGTRNLWLYPPSDDMGCWYSASGTGLGPWGFRCMQPILYYGRCPYNATSRGARPNSCGQVWPNDSNTIMHPCAKPIAFVLWLVQRASLPGYTVLDPFMGSGTTGVACVQTGRKFVGIEICEKYFQIAVKRIEAALAQPRLEGLPK